MTMTYTGCLLVSEWSSRQPRWSGTGSVSMVSFHPIPRRTLHTATYGHVWSRELVTRIQSNSTGSVRPFSGGTAKFRRQLPTDHLEQSAACITITRVVSERFNTCTEEAPVLDRPAPLRRFLRDSGAEYKCTTYLLINLLDI